VQGNYLDVRPSDDTGYKYEAGWEKRTPKSGEIERRKCQIEKGYTREIHEGIERRGGKTGKKGEFIGTGGSPEVVVTAINAGELVESL